MKLKLFFSTLLVSMLIPCIAICQEGQVQFLTDPAEWFVIDRVEWVYGVVVVIGGYLSAFIPGLNNISSGVYRVLTWAVITGAGAVYLGSSIWGVAITYFIATGLYDIVLKLIVRSPRVRDEKGREISGKIEPLIR